MPMTHAKTPPIRRAFTLRELKMLDAQAGTFSGYLAVFENVDAGGDRIAKGAFSKTLAELKSQQQRRQSRYLLPIFFNHDSNQPCGGFTSATEDEHGLFVTGELDLDIEIGQRAYSGMVKGYLPAMSIGYWALKSTYDRDGVRVLRECGLFEGSIVSTPMNPEAVITNVKSATGKATWPLGERDAAWDGAAAHKRIEDWATDSDGNLDPDKLASVHFYSPTGDARQNISAYKLLFCDVVSGDVKAMPKGIFACAGSHGVEAAEGISAADKDAIKQKISAYYRRMADEFKDKSIVAPWETDGGKGKSMPTRKPASGKALDFTTALQAVSADDTLQDDWGDAFQALVNALYSTMCQATMSAMASDDAGFDAQDAAETILAQFSDAMSDLVKRSVAANFCPTLDDDGDSFYDPDGPNAVADGAGYMARDTSDAEQKRGAVMSAANHKALGAMVAQAKALHASMKAFHAKMTPSSNANDANDSEPGGDGDNTDTTQSGDKDTQSKSLNGAGREQRETTPLTADEIETLIRARLIEQRAKRSA